MSRVVCCVCHGVVEHEEAIGYSIDHRASKLPPLSFETCSPHCDLAFVQSLVKMKEKMLEKHAHITPANPDGLARWKEQHE